MATSGPVTAKRPSSSSDERAALVASRAHLLAHRDPVNLLREARVAVLLGPAPRGEHRRARAQGRVMRARDLHRPEPPALEQVGHVAGHLLAHHHVQPVVGLDARRAARQERLLSAHDHAQQRVSGQPERAHQLPDDRVVGAHRVLHDLGPEAADRARLDERLRQRRLAGGHAEPAGEPLDRRALEQRRDHDREEDDVEEVAALALRHTLDHGKRGEHDRDRTAEAGPTEHQPLARGEAIERSRERGRQRPREEDKQQPEGGPLDPYVVQLAREDEQAKREEHDDLSHPGEPLVENRHGLLRRDACRAEHEARQVGGEEAGAVQRLGAAEREAGGGERGDGVEAGARQLRGAQAAHGQPSDAQADDRPDAHLPDEQPEHVHHAVVRLLDPLDEAHDEQDGHRIVEAGLALQRSRELAPQGRLAQQREDRRAVGGGDDRAEQHPLERREIEQPRCREAADDRGAERSEDRKRERRAQDRPDLFVPRRQPALEQDQRQRHHPDRARQLVVVELDPAEPVGADRHADREEEQEAGQADSRRKQGCANSRSEQRRRDKDQLAVRHPGQRASHVRRSRRRVPP